MEPEEKVEVKPLDTFAALGLCETTYHRLRDRFLHMLKDGVRAGGKATDEENEKAATEIMFMLEEYRLKGTCGPKCEQTPGYCMRSRD